MIGPVCFLWPNLHITMPAMVWVYKGEEFLMFIGQIDREGGKSPLAVEEGLQCKEKLWL